MTEWVDIVGGEVAGVLALAGFNLDRGVGDLKAVVQFVVRETKDAVDALASLSSEEKQRGVISISAGNHAQAVAYHGRRLGIPVTIVMPASTDTAGSQTSDESPTPST